MTDRQLTPAMGATRYDLLGMHDEDFESMVGRLVRLEFDTAFKPSNRPHPRDARRGTRAAGRAGW
jgi:hypothetical protein